jgi:short-subunit dehydrogenase
MAGHVDEVLDVTDPDACRALAERLRPRVWVNNAGVLASGSATSQSLVDVQRCVEVNLLGTVYGSRAAASVMSQHGGGRILNIGSLASWLPVPGEAVYSATKHAVRAFSFALAAELRGSGVRVQLLCPDGIWTPMLHDRLHDPHAAMSFTSGRLLDAAEVAEAAMSLLAGRSLVRTVPRYRALPTRALGVLPGATLALLPVLRRVGAVNQWRRRRSQPARSRP